MFGGVEEGIAAPADQTSSGRGTPPLHAMVTAL